MTSREDVSRSEADTLKTTFTIMNWWKQLTIDHLLYDDLLLLRLEFFFYVDIVSRLKCSTYLLRILSRLVLTVSYLVYCSGLLFLFNRYLVELAALF